MARRILKRKRVPILSGDDEFDEDNYVDIPVIFEIDITGSLGQLFTYRFYNDSTTQLRTVRVKKVGNVTGDFDDPENLDTDDSAYVNAERIQTMAFSSSLDVNQAWRTDKKLKNQDPAPKTQEGLDDPRHLRVHYVRYHKDNDPDQSWIDVELIDEMSFLYSRGQEYGFKLRHPTADDYVAQGGEDFGITVGDNDPYQPMLGWCDPTLDLLPVEFNQETGKPVAVRLDPFQNIVNVSGGVYVIVLFTWHDFLTAPMGERYTLTQNLFPQAHAFTPGIDTRVTSAAAVDIVCIGASEDSLLNGNTAFGGQPELVETGDFSAGYPKFPDCFTLEGAGSPVVIYPNNDPNGFFPLVGYCGAIPPEQIPLVTSDPVPFTQFARSFLFDISASNPATQATDAVPTKLEFEIFGLPGPRLATWVERTLPTYPGGPGPIPFSFAEKNSNSVCQLSFQLYVFKKSQVDLYPSDLVFPLRLKGIDPELPNAVQLTKDEFRLRLISIGDVNQGWVDGNEILHEPLSDAQIDTGEEEPGTFSEGSTGSQTVSLTFNFEKLTIGPGVANLPGNVPVNRELPWPVEPPGETVEGVIGRTQFDQTAILGEVHIRQYRYFWQIDEFIFSHDNEIDFGVSPDDITA